MGKRKEQTPEERVSADRLNLRYMLEEAVVEMLDGGLAVSRCNIMLLGLGTFRVTIERVDTNVAPTNSTPGSATCTCGHSLHSHIGENGKCIMGCWCPKFRDS